MNSDQPGSICRAHSKAAIAKSEDEPEDDTNDNNDTIF